MTVRDSGRRLNTVWNEPFAQLSDQIIDEAVAGAFAAAPADVTFERRILRGRPAPVLAGIADGANDLIVLGSRRHRWLGPGVARACIRYASCPVVVVPPPWLATRKLSRDLDRDLRHLTKDS
ncbi:universal stress protein [Actinoplanes sp. NPDC026670]|uniref:universal stress protein n=1 Tax=Actinoplanes sp. NPDC026670 TaxID=3154700 RepID=UPI0034036464